MFKSFCKWIEQGTPALLHSGKPMYRSQYKAICIIDLRGTLQDAFIAPPTHYTYSLVCEGYRTCIASPPLASRVLLLLTLSEAQGLVTTIRWKFNIEWECLSGTHLQPI